MPEPEAGEWPVGNAPDSERTVQRTVREVRTACADARDEYQLLRSVAERVRATVPYHGGAWLVTDPATSLFTNGHVEQFEAEVCEPWFDNELHVEDVHKFRHLVGRPPVVLSRAGGKHGSARWKQLMRPHGMDDEVRFTLDDATGCWGTVELHRAVGARPFSWEEASVLAGIRRP